MRHFKRLEIACPLFSTLLARIYLPLTPPKKNEPVIPTRSEESQTLTCKSKIDIPTRHLYLFYDIYYLIFSTSVLGIGSLNIQFHY